MYSLHTVFGGATIKEEESPPHYSPPRTIESVRKLLGMPEIFIQRHLFSI